MKFSRHVYFAILMCAYFATLKFRDFAKISYLDFIKGTITSKLRKTKHFSQCPQAVHACTPLLLFLSQLTTTSIYTENSPEK